MPGTPLPSSPEASARFRAQRDRDTRPELLLRRALHKRGFRYRLHQTPIRRWRRTVDILFPREKVAVDVRGCFWHSCPQHGSKPRANGQWWADKLARNTERDRETEAGLREEGWLVVVVWEHEDAEKAAERVVGTVLARRAPAQLLASDGDKGVRTYPQPAART